MAGEYRTRQRTRIVQLLAQNRERHLSADEIEALLNAEGPAIGKATIYRCLDRLVEQGVARRYTLGERVGACYQLMDGACHHHYHFVCTACGALLHIECRQLDEIEAHVQNEHGFTIDPTRTVFYGLCKKCSGGIEE